MIPRRKRSLWSWLPTSSPSSCSRRLAGPNRNLRQERGGTWPPRRGSSPKMFCACGSRSRRRGPRQCAAPGHRAALCRSTPEGSTGRRCRTECWAWQITHSPESTTDTRPPIGSEAWGTWRDAKSQAPALQRVCPVPAKACMLRHHAQAAPVGTVESGLVLGERRTDIAGDGQAGRTRWVAATPFVEWLSCLLTTRSLPKKMATP